MDIIGLIIIVNLIVAIVVLTLLYVEWDIYGPLIGATAVSILLFGAWNIFGPLVSATAVLALLMVTAALLIAWNLQRRKMASGLSEWWSREKPTTDHRLHGLSGLVSEELSPRGEVHVNGEYWNAVSDTGETIVKDAEVVVLDVDGLTLRVSKADE